MIKERKKEFKIRKTASITVYRALSMRLGRTAIPSSIEGESKCIISAIIALRPCGNRLL